MLVTQKIGVLHVVAKDASKIEVLKRSEYFDSKQHGANVRARELCAKGEICFADSKKVTDAEYHTQVNPVLLTSDDKFLNGVFFFTNKENANEKLEKLQKNNDADMVEVAFLRNIPKSEQ